MLLQVKNLRLTYRLDGETREALKGVSLCVYEGEVYCLLGESGSGKTAVLRSIMGLLPPNARCSGEVFFDGVDLLALSEGELSSYRGRRISMIFQEPMTALNPTMRVGEQVAEVLRHHFGEDPEKAREQVVELFRRLEIPEPEARYDYYPHLLSGGMRQRVVIAMALIADPELVLADEPTTALDVTVQAQILRLMDSLVRERGASMLFVTHDISVAAEIGDRIGVLFSGVMVEEGSLSEVISNPLHPYTRALMEAVPLPDERPLRAMRFEEVPAAAGGCPFYPRCHMRGDECLLSLPPLRDAGGGHLVRCVKI